MCSSPMTGLKQTKKHYAYLQLENENHQLACKFDKDVNNCETDFVLSDEDE